MKIQVAFGRPRAARERQVNILKAVQPARPALCGPGFIQCLDVPYFFLSHAMNRCLSASEYDM